VGYGPKVRLTFCGVRGSTPAPGPKFVRTGGHTSCVALAHDGQRPRLLLDAGTGIRNVTGLLDSAAFSGAIVLGHLHWDHTQGLPFFAAGDRADSSVDVYLPAQGDAFEVLSRMMSPPHFPIAPDELRGSWRFLSMDPGTTDIEGFDVQADDISHSPTRTFGLRVSDDSATIAYLSDHRPGPAYLGGEGPLHEESALRLARDCDVLIHDAQHLDAEYEARAYMGHSPVGYALALAEAAGARRLVLFHHDPGRTDEEIDAIASSVVESPVAVTIATEGMELDVPAAS
jgi:phosphoribosyl 1,2-cyclic phosphodiesterase